MNEDSLTVSDLGSTVVVSVSRCLREKRIKKICRQQMVGMGVNYHLISRERGPAEPPVPWFWAARGKKLPRKPVLERLPGTSKPLSMSVPLSFGLRDRKERGGNRMSLREMV